MRAIYCALLHHPVKDRAGDTVTTAVTTLDVHDIARSARTYALRGYFVVSPIEAQHALIGRILEHWESGAGRRRMPERGQALAICRPLHSLEDVCGWVREQEGQTPELWATAARPPVGKTLVGFEDGRGRLALDGPPVVLLFGTGHGLADDLLRAADVLLSPIAGRDGYNHLSVRSAAAIVFDRLLGA
ncbi:MAG: RNA methyltransferase [Myxococcales bacterium]|nr:RNA methyltransferase [Myxococcales bacterium]